MKKDNLKLVIIGAGGHAKVCYEIAQLMGRWTEIIVLDDNSESDYFEIVGSVNDYSKYTKESEYFVAIGDNKIRETLISQLISEGLNMATLIHPQAIISSSVEIGTGSVIMPGVVINSVVIIGIGCIINTSSSIDHDNVIKDFVHISPGVHMAGSVCVGSSTWVGIGSTIIHDICIGNNTIIGAGSTVVNNVPPNCTVVGTPASKIH